MTICYFGIYDPQFGRNRIYRKGLQENGVTIIECNDSSRGMVKYWRLWQKHRALGGNYDALIVGYPGHLVVPFAKFLSRKSVVADLLGSLTDAEEHSHRPSLLRVWKSRLIDRLAVHFADIVLLESEAQKRFFIERFGASEKYRVLYTGADNSIFYRTKPRIEKPFIVLFRGRLTTESGILHMLEAAHLLTDKKDIQFRIIGVGPLLPQVKTVIAEKKITNVELIAEHLSEDTLRDKMCEASLSLGQFEDNPRLSRTIPHKAFESFALGLPYLSGAAPAVREVITNGETGFLVPRADPAALAEKIRALSTDRAALAKVATAARTMYEKRFSPLSLGAGLVSIILDSF